MVIDTRKRDGRLERRDMRILNRIRKWYSEPKQCFEPTKSPMFQKEELRLRFENIIRNNPELALDIIIETKHARWVLGKVALLIRASCKLKRKQEPYTIYKRQYSLWQLRLERG